MNRYAIITPDNIVVEECETLPDGEAIHDLIGNYFDCVSMNMRDGSVLVAYVDDMGHLHGLPMNAWASSIFARPLAGTAIMFSATSPQGEYDGENYPLNDLHVFMLRNMMDLVDMRPTPMTEEG